MNYTILKLRLMSNNIILLINLIVIVNYIIFKLLLNVYYFLYPVKFMFTVQH